LSQASGAVRAAGSARRCRAIDGDWGINGGAAGV